MRFRVRFDFYLDVGSFDEANEIHVAARREVVRMAGGAATTGGESGALLDSELVPLDPAAVDAMAAEDLGPGIVGAVVPLRSPPADDEN